MQKVDFGQVEFFSCYHRLQKSVEKVDPRVCWIRPVDRERVHTNVDDLKTFGHIIEHADDDWWKSSVSSSPPKEEDEVMNSAAPIAPNSTLFFSDILYDFVGYDLNESTSLLSWQSWLMYANPVYQLVYPCVLILLNYLLTIYWGGCLSFWRYLVELVSGFMSGLRRGFKQACLTLFRPLMYLYALYESFRTKKVHDDALTKATEEVHRRVQTWKDQFDTVSSFCGRLKQWSSLSPSSYLYTRVVEPFEKSLLPFYESFFKEYAYLSAAEKPADVPYKEVGKTLALRWQMSLTGDRAKGSCMEAAQVLSKLASKVSVLRLWNLVMKRPNKRLHRATWLEEAEEAESPASPGLLAEGGHDAEDGEEEEDAADRQEGMTGVCYPFLVVDNEDGAEEIVTNDCYFGRKNAIITGPNATGKTTYLKSVMMNLMFAHHVGVGFFKECRLLRPFYNFCCYINVPDTSARESLFQAEASRALTILRSAEKAGKEGKRTFAIFDELFTGTNPEDAARVTRGILRHLCENENLRFLTTTHFTTTVKEMQEEDESAKQSSNDLSNESPNDLSTESPNDLSNQSSNESSKERSGECCGAFFCSKRRKQSASGGVTARRNGPKYMRTEIDETSGRPTYRIVQGVSRDSNVDSVLKELGFPVDLLMKMTALSSIVVE